MTTSAGTSSATSASGGAIGDQIVAALKLAIRNPATPRTSLAELMFYAYAHRSELRRGALGNLKQLVAAGVRTPNCTYEPHIHSAQDGRHPEVWLLCDLAKVLQHGHAPAALEAHVAWRNAG